MQEKSMIRSAFILTFGTIVSRVIGILYVFLFSYLVSSKGLALYSYAYIPYVIFLDLATLGIPLGVIKIISLYDQEEKLEYSYVIYKKVKLISLTLGIIMFIMMYLLSDHLASIILAGEESIENNVRDVSNVIKIISTALIIIPNLALVRGIFNSIKYTRKTAYSQIIEQLIRVGIILLSSFIIIRLMDLSYVYAIYIAVLAATISGLIAYLIINYNYKQIIKSHQIDKTISTTYDIDYKQMLRTLMHYAIPVVFITIIFSLYSFIDTVTFNRAYLLNGFGDSEVTYATYAFEISKLIMLPTSLGVALGISIIVYTREKIKQANYTYLNSQIKKAFQTLLFVIMPIVILFMVFNKAIYCSLFSYYNPYGPAILYSAAPLILLYGLLNITNGIIQSIHKEWLLIISMLCGVFFKYIYNIYLIGIFKFNGAILATFIGLLITTIINLIIIKYETKIQYVYLTRRVLTIILLASGLGIVFYLFNFVILPIDVPYNNRFLSLLFAGINSILYVIIYALISYYLGLFEMLLGRKMTLKELLGYLNLKAYIKNRHTML